MPGADDLFNVLGRLDQLRQSLAGEVLGLAIPEMLKDVVEGIEGLEFVAQPLRQALSGLGGLSEVLGPEMATALGDLAGSLKDLWDLGGGTDIVEEVTKSVGALRQFSPLKD